MPNLGYSMGVGFADGTDDLPVAIIALPHQSSLETPVSTQDWPEIFTPLHRHEYREVFSDKQETEKPDLRGSLLCNR